VYEQNQSNADSGVFCPMAIRLTGKSALVVGGGAVAERKTARLLRYGARVTLISPEISPKLREIATEKRIEYKMRGATTADVDNYELVIIATGNRELNAQLARAARSRAIPVNRSDDPADCDFVFPADFEAGPLTVAVFSNGSAPVLASWLRNRIQAAMEPEIDVFATLVIRVRENLNELYANQDQRAEALNRLVHSNVFDILRAHGPEAAWQRALEIVKDSDSAD
jgi:siroheme synthase-like protein